MSKNATKKVMIVHPVGDPQQVPLLRGISQYANECGQWVLDINPEMFSCGLRHLRGWPGNGLIAFLRTKNEVSAAKSLGFPVVNLAGLIRHTGVPRVMVDHRAMGRLAAEHLMGCGLRRFAYCGEREMWYSQLRKQGFLERLAAEGLPCSVFEWNTRFGPRNPWYQWLKPTEEWLKTLVPPVGLFAVRDYAGTVLIDACLRLGLRVPEDVAVVGVDNDLMTCEFCAVPLSSVARSNREVGYQAAALLDRLMAGEAPPADDIVIPPEGVVKRHSTDTVVVEDPRIAAVIQYVHEHLAEPLSLDVLCEKVSMSHRSLDLHFKKYLHCSPREYICRTRVERCKRLLASKERPKLQQIARACGFTGERHLRTVFQRITGQTPSEYRLQLPDASLWTL
jgi:LacI family transcriptional regulator